MPRSLLGILLSLVLAPAAVWAQQAIAGYNTTSDAQLRIGLNHWKLTGGVELEQGNTKIYGETIEIFGNEDRAIATGNVVFTQGANRIAADRADFNTKTRLGTFYNATGIATVQPPRQNVRPGAAMLPPVPGQETRVYFYGEKVVKIGPKKYRITNGGFTSCVQPTPRWIFTSSTITLNLEHYTVLQNAVFNVKGVPMFYLPYMLYPTKKEDRATGFLIPTYGSSTLRGQSIGVPFFWAIDRSQDATFVWDYFSKTGEGAGSEYRYNFGGGSDGNIRAYTLNTHATEYTNPDGSTSDLAASRSFEIHGNANQILPGNLRARGRIDYFSDITANRTFNTNINYASLNQRTYGGNVVGAWRTYTLNATYDHSEYFYDSQNSSVSGYAPRLTLTRNERPLFGSDLYFSAAGEYAYVLRDNKSPDVETNTSLGRVDFTPQIRYPFKQWEWFTVNTSLSWRDTYYSRSNLLDPVTGLAGVLAAGPALNRQFFTVQAQMLGPVFNRIWDTPENGYAEKFKHSVEPFFNIQRTSAIDDYDRIVKLDSTDYIVGGTTQYNYGVTNRFYAKRREGARAQAREILDVQIDQTYYTNALASQYDTRYATSFTGASPNPFSPVALSVRGIPTNDLNFTVRAEFDSTYRSMRTISAGGTYSWTGRVQTTLAWSKKNYIPQLSGFNDPNLLDQYVNATTNVHTKDNRFGGIYAFNYDILHSLMLQQRITAFYNAQCCGIAMEYQAYNYSYTSIPVPVDHRFFLSFTLAGIGNFSPFNGAMSGVPR